MKKTSLFSHLLVALQFIGVTLSFFHFEHSSIHNNYFLLLSLIGILLGIFTLMFNQVGNFRIYPEIKPESQLIISGPYRFIRHPMYSSLMLVILGISLWHNHAVNYVGLAGVAAAVFLKARKEESLLLERFPEYEQYIQKTTGFIPFVV